MYQDICMKWFPIMNKTYNWSVYLWEYTLLALLSKILFWRRLPLCNHNTSDNQSVITSQLLMNFISKFYHLGSRPALWEGSVRVETSPVGKRWKATQPESGHSPSPFSTSFTVCPQSNGRFSLQLPSLILSSRPVLFLSLIHRHSLCCYQFFQKLICLR